MGLALSYTLMAPAGLCGPGRSYYFEEQGGENIVQHYNAGITSLLTDISTEMVYPLIPLFLVSSLGATPVIVGIIEGLAESLASLLKVFSGYIADRFNRRKPLAIFGYGFSAVSKILIVFASSWTWILGKNRRQVW